MSTELQLKGDSRRRQLEASRLYAEENGLELASADQLEDIGISAFKGLNVKEGALGKFLEAVKTGTVEAGSYLLVESLDRITRQPILKSLSLFLDIIQSGIVLVTLSDKKVFRPGETDFSALIVSLTTLARAHEESAIKSERISAAWKNKRVKAASGQPMTAWAPAWLKLSQDRKTFEVIPERADIVRQIFEDAASGMGMYSIVTRLNAANVRTFSSSDGWHQSYIAKILANRAVIGEFQPGIRKDGVRVDEGEPIKNYYPAVVSEDLFYRAQLGKAQRRGTSAGRKGKAFTNLFAGLATCAYCRSKVLYENKGSGPKGGAYLICDNAKRKLGCPGLRWKYSDFETSFLALVEGLDLASILNASEDGARRKAMEADIAALQGEIVSTSKLMEQTYLLLNEGGPAKFIAEKLTQLETRLEHLSIAVATKDAEKQSFEAREARFYSSRDQIKELVGQLQAKPDSELYKLRAQIASRLRAIIDILAIAPHGHAPQLLQHVENAIAAGELSADEIDHMTSMAERPIHTRRYFAVGFKDAPARLVYPKQDDPLSYDMRIDPPVLSQI